MAFQRKKLASALALALGGGAIVAAAPALAQDIRVEVTGSNIKRVDVEGALPVTVLTREEIAQTGVTSAQDLLQYVTAATSAGNFNASTVIGATTFGLQTASLRGLGGSRTLVLVNGRRLPGFSGDQLNGQSTNLSTIPFGAIERVEVLKDGASAIYGTDAVAGVINFILRKDYQGYEATAYYGAPTRSSESGGDIIDITATAGWGDLSKDRWNVLLNANYHKEDSLLQRARDFSNTSIIPSIGLFGFSSNTFPATVTAPPGFPASTGNPTWPNCAPSVQGPDDVYGPNNRRCVYDPSVDAQSYPEVEQWSLYGSARYQFNSNWQGFLTGLYAKSENHNVIQPVPLSDVFNDPLILQSSSPYYPTSWMQQNYPTQVGNPLNVRYRAVLNGNRDVTDTNEAWRIIGGVEGTWKTGDIVWDTTVAGFYGESETTQKLNGGFPVLSQIVPLFNTGVINPFGPTPDNVVQQVLATNYNGTAFTGTTTMYGVDGKVSGEVWKLPAGMMAVALGAEYRREEITNDPSPALQTGDISGYGGSFEFINRDRDVFAVYAEAIIPIVKGLEMTAAVRYDDYSDIGGTTNPKVGLRWQPVRELLVRGSWGTGFLAPSLQQLWLSQREGVTQAGLSDPLRCPTTGDTTDCLTQFNVLYGGNPDLFPEKSDSTTAGFIWEPNQYVSIGLDWWKINLEDTIVAGIDPSTILGDLSSYGYLVTRGPVQPNYPTLPGPITEIAQTNTNLGKSKIQGIDLDLKLRSEPTSIGRFLFNLTGTYYLQYDTQNLDGTYSDNISTVYGQAVTGLIPKWKHYATINWQYGPWSATLGNLYQTDYTDFQEDLDGNLRTVDAMSLWDLQGTYTGFKNWKLTLGVKNLFDKNPPLTNQQYTFQSGYDPSYYDARARFLYGSVTYSFK